MLNRFANIFNHAVEALAPPSTALENFIHNWKSITHFFVDNKVEKCQIEDTKIPKHLDQMLNNLLEEERSSETGSTGPCMEYMLQHKLLDTLYTLGRTDHPPGMKQHVLLFFTHLLSRISQPLLPHVAVYKAVHKLVRVCGEIKAAPTENEEIKFLCTVCAKIKSDPYLVNFFIEMPKPVQLTKKGQVLCPEQKNPEFHLIQSLLLLAQSEDGRIVVKSCEGLMLCVSLPETFAASCIVNHTSFCNEMIEKLNHLYKKLPKFMDPSDIDITEAKWGLDIYTDASDCHKFAGKRQLLSFLSWLDFIDQMIFVADFEIAKALAQSIKDDFLKKTIQPAILQTSESGCVTSIALLTRCVRLVQSPHLLTVLTNFILDDEKWNDDEKKDLDAYNKVGSQLLQKCNHLSDEVTITALHLFEMLILKHNETILHRLLLKNLETRAYYDPHLVNGVIDDKGAGDSLEGIDDLPSNGDVVDSPNNLHDDVTVNGAFFPSTSAQLHKVVHSFLSLLGDELKSSTNLEDGGYDTYLRDAHRQFFACQTHCASFGWSSESESSHKVKSTEKFQEGPFLKVLLDKLSRMLDQSYTVNLQVTSVIAKLSLLPHPCLHEYLLDPFLPLASDCRSLYSILKKLSSDITVRATSYADFGSKLTSLRKTLLGEEDVINRGLDDQNLLGSVIVLEEFCKELAAIAFVKQHHSPLPFT